jgi:hypothetical protein
MSNLNHFKMKNLILFLMVSLFTTQLLATQSVTATKFETSKTELSVMVKPIVFENVQLNSPDVMQLESVSHETHISADKRPKRGKGYNYTKHYRKSKRHGFFSRLFNTDNCNHYRKHGYV